MHVLPVHKQYIKYFSVLLAFYDSSMVKHLSLIHICIFNLAFDLELESGIVINPVLENEAHYRYWLGALSFYDNVEKEGIVMG